MKMTTKPNSAKPTGSNTTIKPAAKKSGQRKAKGGSKLTLEQAYEAAFEALLYNDPHVIRLTKKALEQTLQDSKWKPSSDDMEKMAERTWHCQSQAALYVSKAFIHAELAKSTTKPPERALMLTYCNIRIAKYPPGKSPKPLENDELFYEQAVVRTVLTDKQFEQKCLRLEQRGRNYLDNYLDTCRLAAPVFFKEMCRKWKRASKIQSKLLADKLTSEDILTLLRKNSADR